MRVRLLHRMRRAVAATSVACLFLALVLALGGPLRSAEAHSALGRPPGGTLSDPVVRAVDIASPSVVRLATLYDAHITLNPCGQSITLPRSGPGYTVGALGSGAFISSHGDILTADHVVDVDHGSLDQEIFQNDSQAAQDIANALNNDSCAAFSPQLTANDIANGYVQYAGIPFTTHYSEPQHLVWRDTSYTGALSAQPQDASDILTGLLSAQHWQATVLATSSFNQDDAAVVHIALEDTPSITLDDSNGVEVMDRITVVGFPGNGDANNDPTNLLTPSVNTASVSAIKVNDDGAALIQVGGNIEHGDSGGPALDTNGHIVGIVSFGGPDTTGITAFLRSSNSAQNVIGQTSVTPNAGPFERRWEQAFSDYASTSAGHWQKAARELDALATSYPDYHGVDPYKDYADHAAETETVAPSFPVDPILAGSLAALVIGVALLLFLFFVLRRARVRPTVAVSPATAPYYSAYPGYAPYSGYGPPSHGYASPMPGYAPPPSVRLAQPGSPVYSWPTNPLPQPPQGAAATSGAESNGGQNPSQHDIAIPHVESFPPAELAAQATLANEDEPLPWTLEELRWTPMGRISVDEPPEDQ